MDADKKLIMLFIYWIIFIFSFYGAFQTRNVLLGKNDGDFTVKFFWNEIHLKNAQSVINMKYVFYTLSTLALVASIFLVYWVINYNYEVVKDKPNLAEEEIKKIWSKDNLDNPE